MNIHLLRSPELKVETYRNVLDLLNQVIGPIYFISCEEDLQELNSDDKERDWEQKKDFQKLKKRVINTEENSIFYDTKIKFPYVEKVKSWEQLFAECDSYRRLKKIPNKDIVVLLTDIGNDGNWFGGISESMNNFFVHTTNWEYYLGNTIDIRYPIAYEVIIWVMRYYMFPNRDAMEKGVHLQSIGCIMDFCEHKSQINLKMRTADVCESCMNKFIERDIPVLYTRQFFDILDGIRNNMTFRGRSKLLNDPSKMEIRGKKAIIGKQNEKILFTDLEDLELKLNPKEKAVYFFFLKHSEGILLSHLKDYKTELLVLYRSTTKQNEEGNIKKAIDDLISPTENEINVVLSKINRKIKEAVGKNLYDFYCIQGERGEKKFIKLDRELLIYTKT